MSYGWELQPLLVFFLGKTHLLNVCFCETAEFMSVTSENYLNLHLEISRNWNGIQVKELNFEVLLTKDLPR